MPPKGANKRAAPASPVRQAPSRSAKTRSQASTASMYKEAAKFRDFDDDIREEADEEDDEEDLSDIVSDPEEIISATESENENDFAGEESIELDSDDMGQVGVTTKKQIAAKKGPGTRSRANPKETMTSQKKASKPAEPTPKKTRTATSKVAPLSRPVAKPTSRTASSSSAVADNRKRPSDLKFAIRPSASGASSSSSSSSSSTLPTSRRGPAASFTFDGENQEDESWAEKYAPTTISEVAVHPKKIAQVRDWLEKYTAQKSPHAGAGGSILILTGPAGSGKTTVLRMLAKEMNLHIVEWINSVNENSIIRRPPIPGQDSWRPSSIDDEYFPVMRAFEEFFARAHRFQPLQTLQGDLTAAVSPSSSVGTAPFGKRKNIILIEDLPPVSAYSSRKIFQDTISKFSISGGNRSSAVLVIIVSDVYSKQSTELLFPSSNESKEEALTVRTLLPANLLTRIDSGGSQSGPIMQIKFNPVAVTIQKKALKSLVDKEFKGSAAAYLPDAAEIAELIDIHDGDLRATINALQFLCLLKTKERKRLRDVALKMEEEQAEFTAVGAGPDSESIQTQGQDSSLGVFHAVARVLYNKRNWTKPSVAFDSDIVKVPPQAWSKQRPPLSFNPDKDLIEKLPVELELYTLMLHQNYSRHLNTIEECSTAMEYLCIADQFSGSSSYLHSVQMQPYMSSVVVRGLLFAPKSPGPSVTRTGSGGAKKHWWPELYAVNRAKRANDQMLYEVASDLAGAEERGLSSGHIYGPGFLPKAVIRHEIVPMLHRCVSMNPYMPIMNQVLRPSSKNFVRHQAASYGLKLGMERKKEFGEGDEGFTEEIMDPSADSSTPYGEGLYLESPSTNISSPSQSPWNNKTSSLSSTPQRSFRSHRPLFQQQPPKPLHSYGSIGALPPAEDPIADFSD